MTSPCNVPPCVVYEDDDLLVVNKPPGWNSHSPAPHAGEGIYDWLKHREPRWARLAIIHRLDKETSGLLAFGKTPDANRALTDQFTRRAVNKRYILVTDRPAPRDGFTVVSAIVRSGARYVARPLSDDGDRAETRFRVVRREGAQTWIEAEPVTGRTHQIRVHAAAEGMPILGDSLYGGTATASRLHLHAAALELQQPRSGEILRFAVPPDFSTPAARQLRDAVVDRSCTDAFRCVHGAADREPGRYRDRLGAWLLFDGADTPTEQQASALLGPGEGLPQIQGVYRRQFHRKSGNVPPTEASPQLLAGTAAPERFPVRENGVTYEISFAEGNSVGLFLDQRDNRRRLLHGNVAAGFPLYAEQGIAIPEVLNCFAYTCAFSVCAALGGARVTSLDLSRKYLDWGRRNFQLNGLDPAGHDFIYGDVFDWLKRLAKKARQFDVLLLDPPTFSRSREHGDFRSETDYGRLVALALLLLRPGGVILASTNTARLGPETFIGQVRAAILGAGRDITQEHYVPQPPDFPVTRDEPAHLKTLWLRIAGAQHRSAPVAGAMPATEAE
jgi:23S rRNA (cytosine1962-C5)-methyltransferase